MAKLHRRLDAVSAGNAGKVALETVDAVKAEPEIKLDTARRSFPSIIEALHLRSADYRRMGDHVGDGHLAAISVAAGQLKLNLKAAQGHFHGETATMLDRLYEIL